MTNLNQTQPTNPNDDHALPAMLAGDAAADELAARPFLAGRAPFRRFARRCRRRRLY